MTKIFLSPSDQKANTYASGNTNEAEVCCKIADAVEKHLSQYKDVSVKNDQLNTMQGRVSASNIFGADVHVCIHTNACNEHTAGGTRVFYYSETSKGKQIAKCVFDELAPLTPTAPDKMVTYPSLYEIKNAKAPTVYCECEFHDVPKQADWILAHIDEIGGAIARGLAKYFNLQKKDEKGTMEITVDCSKYSTIKINLNS